VTRAKFPFGVKGKKKLKHPFPRSQSPKK